MIKNYYKYKSRKNKYYHQTKLPNWKWKLTKYSLKCSFLSIGLSFIASWLLTIFISIDVSQDNYLILILQKLAYIINIIMDITDIKYNFLFGKINWFIMQTLISILTLNYYWIKIQNWYSNI